MELYTSLAGDATEEIRPANVHLVHLNNIDIFMFSIKRHSYLPVSIFNGFTPHLNLSNVLLYFPCIFFSKKFSLPYLFLYDYKKLRWWLVLIWVIITLPFPKQEVLRYTNDVSVIFRGDIEFLFFIQFWWSFFLSFGCILYVNGFPISITHNFNFLIFHPILIQVFAKLSSLWVIE